MNEYDYVVFEIDDVRLAVPSSVVDKVERAVQLTAVPDGPESVLGVVSDGGEIVPVLGLRTRFGMKERDIRLSDRLLFCRSCGRRIAVIADSVQAVSEIAPEKCRSSAEIWPGVLFIESVADIDGDVVLVQDMDAVLNSELELKLDDILRALRLRSTEEVD
ncbi:chemotaxis protein CheW [Maridesulfovibrio sp.]|uniref:chemotaxis protein CheW n=1 Tax=Maridesulfovibrio sp. TaxID=2795000 RepID=UPI002A18CA48|nr:chemotaxis protein CheW [Maridesulfovibrio sp.]